MENSRLTIKRDLKVYLYILNKTSLLTGKILQFLNKSLKQTTTLAGIETNSIVLKSKLEEIKNKFCQRNLIILPLVGLIRMNT